MIYLFLNYFYYEIGMSTNELFITNSIITHLMGTRAHTNNYLQILMNRCTLVPNHTHTQTYEDKSLT